MSFSQFLEQLNESKNAALVVGAGISHDVNVPLGYRLPMEFGQEHPDLLKTTGIFNAWQTAYYDTSKDKWQHEDQFVKQLTCKFGNSIELQQTLLDWMTTYEKGVMQEVPKDKHDKDIESTIHAVLAFAWLKRIFKHLVTTNWDFLLEYYVDKIYWESYAAPFEPVHYTFKSGATCTIDYNHLFFQESLGGDDYFTSPRWDIVANISDLPNLKRWTRPLWKIHGSPFFLACPKCGGFSRWKHERTLKVNDPCPEHPDQLLKPEIIFWGQGIDKAYPQVWRRVKDRLKRSDMIVASGFSGSGSDKYIRQIIEQHPNAWVINPDHGAWDLSKVNFIGAKADELTAQIQKLL